MNEAVQGRESRKNLKKNLRLMIKKENKRKRMEGRGGRDGNEKHTCKRRQLRPVRTSSAPKEVKLDQNIK